MQMMVRKDEKGRRKWALVFDEKLLFEVICNCVAWKLLIKSGAPIEKVKAWTVKIVKNSSKEKSDEEINGIKDDFIRSVLAERKRLGLTEFQIKGDDDDKDESSSS